MGLNRKWILGITGVTMMTALAIGSRARADDDAPPSSTQVDTAEATSDLMLATLFAALTQEFAETTPANAAQGKASISLIFNDANKDMRLVGTDAPLHANDQPQDAFETTALSQALTGADYTAVERRSDRWYYRRSVALSNFSPACGVCHTNFGPTNSSQWVGALMLRVPIQ